MQRARVSPRGERVGGAGMGLRGGRVLFGQGIPSRGHGPNPFGMGGRQVDGFRPILSQVVEFPCAAGAGRHDFPVAFPQGSIAFMLPPEGFPLQIGVLGEGGHQAQTGRLGHFRGMILFGPVASGQLKNRGDQIDEMARGLSQGAALSDALRPVSDEGGGDSAFVHPGLVTTERRVRQRRPSRSDAQEGGSGAAQGIRVVTVAPHHDLGAGAVVREEDQQCVFKMAHGLELAADPADLLIHPVHHGGVDRHLVGLELALARG